MSEFEVKAGRLKESAEVENSISKKIDILSSEIRSIAGKIQLERNAEQAVRRNLNALAQNNGDHVNQLRNLSQALSSIASCYEQTEQRISGSQSSEENRLKEKLIELSEAIRRIGECLGMDSTALFSDDPVNLSNGNYVYEKNFFHFDTILPMNIRFFYNVKRQKKGVLGIGWIHNFEKCISHNENTVRVQKEDGAEDIYIWENAKWNAYPGTFGELYQDENGYIHIDEEGFISNYNVDGKMISVKNRDGWSIELSYENGTLSAVECTDGIQLRFFYDEQDRLVQIADHTGRTVQMAYQEGRLFEVTDPQGNITGYEYNEDGYLSAIITPSGNVGLYNEFDEQGRTTAQTFPDGGQVRYLYDEENSSVIMIRQNGDKTEYIHDALYRNTKVIYSDGEEITSFNENNQKTSFRDKLGNETHYAYDGKGRLTEITNALDHTLNLQYTEEGQLCEVQLDGVRMSSCEFDESGHQITQVNARGFQTKFKYDRFGRVIKNIHEDGSETRLFYDKNGNIICVEDPLTGTTKYEYDECHRVICTCDALGNETRYAYDMADNLTEVVNALGNRRSYRYDMQGNLTQIDDYNRGVTEIAYNVMNKPIYVKDADDHITRYTYDLMSNLTAVKMADGSVISYEYDLQNRKTKIIYPSGGEEKAVYDACGNLIQRIAPDGGEYQFKYDALGRPVEVTDPVGGTRKAVFDHMGNVTDIIYEDGSEEHFEFDLLGNRTCWEDKNGYKRYYAYDALNNLTQIRDEQGVLAEYTYLPGGRLLSEKCVDGTAVEYRYDAVGNIVGVVSNTEGAWNFTYDSLGQVVQVEREHLGIERYEYDAMGNVIAVTDAAGNKSYFDYSLAGKLLRVTDTTGVQTAYRYDGCGRLIDMIQSENGCLDIQMLNEYNRSQKELRITSYVRDLSGNVREVVDAEGNTTGYEYDLCGRITAHKDADGNVTQCVYRKDGTEERIRFQDGRSVTYQYDALKRLAQIEDWLGMTRFQRDAQGRLISVTDYQERTVEYQWDKRGQCTEIRYPDGKKVSYQYNDCMHLTGTEYENRKVKYGYYENGQRKERVYDNGMCSRYTYDAAGNLSELCHVDGEHILDRYQYFYDICGRKNKVLEMHDHISEVIDNRYDYNASGSLLSVRRNGEETETYSYDMFGNRTEAICNGVRTVYEYDRLNQLVSSMTGDQVKKYTYDHRGNLSGVNLNGIQKLTLHFDALNRLARAQTDEGEAVYEYNGLDMLVGVRKQIGSRKASETYFYDYTKSFYNMLSFRKNDTESNYVWDNELLLENGTEGISVFLNDERMNPISLISDHDAVQRYTYDTWGTQVIQDNGVSGNFAGFGFTGYRRDDMTGFYHAGKRNYDSSIGRFIAQDPVAGSIYHPVTCNPFIYCIYDPVNRYDPTGAVVAWLAGGIIGAVGNLASKVAGDIVTSIKNGKVTISPWQEYIGSTAGGFVQGTTFIVSGGNAAVAGAAGSATETLISNGLHMISGTQGYRKEDGYGIGNLLTDTGRSAAGGAVSGFAFGKATKYIKIPGITKGTGNWDAAVRGTLTRAAHGHIKNIGTKTIMKGIATQGILKTADSVLAKGKTVLEDFAKEKGIELLKLIFGGSAGGALAASLATIFNSNRSAKCPAAGI